MMRAAPAFAIHRAQLAAHDDFAGWRDQTRALLAAGIPPEQVMWSVAEEAEPDLLTATAAPMRDGIVPTISISRDLLKLLRTGLLHRDPTRFALGYRLLWRMQADSGIGSDPADPDMIKLHKLAKAVRRDIHKMHAFVRFRKVGDANGREQFAAWFEPEHHIVRATAGFFRDRFTGMDWLIATPQASIAWDGKELRKGPGGQASDVPADDGLEAEWRAYYTNIFNPARLKVKAMKREMPVRYWHNLPEAALIAGLVREAGAQVATMMVEKHRAPDLFQPASEPTIRHFDSIEAFNDALKREDVAPSPAFSDRIVTGEGPRHAPIMFVGEQPGDQEDLLDRPFVGPAGQLLDRCLAEAGLQRDQCYLTNAVKRFKFAPRGKRRLHQTPTTGDIEHYRWWLAEEVRLIGPRLIVTLGATALQAMSGRKQALGPVRGTLTPWQDHLLLPTVHPSFLLRLPDEQARDIEHDKFVRDLRKAAVVL